MINSVQVIINADDYGLSNGVNTAIINLMRLGVVTSTSVLANYVTQSDIDELLNATKSKNSSIGLHINLVEGKSVSKKEDVVSLVDYKGCFYSPGKLLLRSIVGLIDENDVRTEVKAQLAKLSNFGLKISHVDSHMHVHIFPFFSKIICSEMTKKGMLKIRCTVPSFIGNIRMLVLKGFSLALWHKYKHFKFPDKLITYFTGNNVTISGLVDHISGQNNGAYEVMVHPSVSKCGDVYDCLNEYKLLNDIRFKDCLLDKHIRLISYNDI